MPRDSVVHTFKVAVLLCLICSLTVSAAAVLLRSYQVSNKILEQRRNILAVAGIDQTGKSVDQIVQERVETRVVNFDAGTYNESIDPASFDQRAAANDPERSQPVPPERDIAGIQRRENDSLVYLVNDETGRLDQIVLPIRGYGLWSTLWGFLSLDADGRTIRGLTFYEHGETPGLGGEVDSPSWKQKWRNPDDVKLAYDEDGGVRIQVVKGAVLANDPNREFKVDGLSGATITTRGVSNMLQYWLGEDGFGPFLANLRNQGDRNGEVESHRSALRSDP